MIDPGTATLIGTGVSALGSAIGGGAAGKGAKSAADQAREAAEQQAQMVVQANRENLFGGFGLEDLSQRQKMLFGGPRERFENFQNEQFASAMEAGPGAQARARQEMAQNLALRQQELSKTGFAPMSRFV